MKRILKWWVILLVVIVVAGGLVAWRSFQTNQNQNSVANLQTVQVQTGTISQSVDATGAVRTGQTAQLAWQTSGTVGSVKVKVGDQVKAGQVIAQLDMSSVSPSIITAQSNLVTAQQAMDTLTQSKTAQAQADLALVTAQKTYTDTLQTANNLLNYSSDPNLTQAQQAYELAQYNVNHLRTVYVNTPGTVDSNPDKIKAKIALKQAVGQRDRAQATVDLYGGAPSEYEIQNADANLAVAQAQLEDAQRAWDAIKNGPSQQSIDSAQAQIDAAKATLNEVNIVAPFDGTITSLPVQVGDQVKSGDAAVQIDNMSALYVDLSISEVDINKIQVGQPVTMTLDAIPGKSYTAKVDSVSTLGTNSNGAVMYTATVKMDNPDAKVKPGMSATATVLVQQKTDALLVPTTALRQFNTRYIVDVVNGNSLTPVPVQIGMQNDTMTEITGGNLKAGEAIVLDPSTITTTRSTGLLGGGIFRIFGGGGGIRTQTTGGNRNFSGGTGGNFSGGSRFNGGSNSGGNNNARPSNGG